MFPENVFTPVPVLVTLPLVSTDFICETYVIDVTSLVVESYAKILDGFEDDVIGTYLTGFT
jgi:hypothetical protein